MKEAPETSAPPVVTHPNFDVEGYTRHYAGYGRVGCCLGFSSCSSSTPTCRVLHSFPRSPRSLVRFPLTDQATTLHCTALSVRSTESHSTGCGRNEKVRVSVYDICSGFESLRHVMSCVYCFVVSALWALSNLLRQCRLVESYWALSSGTNTDWMTNGTAK